MVISKDGLREVAARLRDHTIGLQATCVLLTMAAACDRDNWVHAGQSDIARELGMARQHVSTAMMLLADCGFIERPLRSHGFYRISPKLLWNGSTDDLREAMARAS